MTKGKHAICLGMPFVDHTAGKLAENGWGNVGDTADYVMRTVAEVCEKFGGDRGNLVLTGFSRGAIACGYIGLREVTDAQTAKADDCIPDRLPGTHPYHSGV